MKEELLQKLEVLSPHLPTNTLDELIDGLGGPERVAEMTGRRGRVVSLSDGSIQYQLRSESDISLELSTTEDFTLIGVSLNLLCHSRNDSLHKCLTAKSLNEKGS